MEPSRKIQVKKPSGFFLLGKTYCFAIQGEIYLTIGPDWGFNLCLGTILFSTNIFFILVMAPRVPIELQYLGLFIYLGTFLAYLFTALKNPGIISNSWEIELEETQPNQKYCKECSVTIEQGSEHCYDCQVCVRGYDHHCPLSGKCIGAGNIIPFYAFLVGIFGVMLYFGVWFFIVTKKISG